jgi:hypothetical protein
VREKIMYMYGEKRETSEERKKERKRERLIENGLPETSFFFPRQAETSERWRPALHYICW